MALYAKQDFNPVIFSRRWIAMKFRPNMLLHSHQNIIQILESGLLFREDSIEVEQEAPVEEMKGWFSTGEKVAAVAAVGACLTFNPPRSLSRSSLLLVSGYLTLPILLRTWHRIACRGTLPALLKAMRAYLALSRRAAACLRECAALRAQLGSVSSAIESTHKMLCRQQSEMAITMSRASSALLGNAPWLKGDVAWDAIIREKGEIDNLTKIHHAFLVVQSALLKHIALAHFIPTANVQKIYKNHNERIYWIHDTLLKNLIVDFKDNYNALERMYRLLKNYGSDNNLGKRPGAVLRDVWAYSEVHTGIARANLELKLALNKSSNLDQFLDSCALNNQFIDLEVLNRDINSLIDDITKCLTTVQNSQIRLKKLQNKFVDSAAKSLDEQAVDDGREILKIEDREPETIDEVFYFIKTDDYDDADVQPNADISTVPGKQEKETTKVVLNELKSKLVRREDLMRERERQALVKTMPQLKNMPEFPRQIKMEDYSDNKGFITKIRLQISKKKLFNNYKIKAHKSEGQLQKYNLVINKKGKIAEFEASNVDIYKTYSMCHLKINRRKYNDAVLTFDKGNNIIYIKKWCNTKNKQHLFEFTSDSSAAISDLESLAVTKKVLNKTVDVDPNVGGEMHHPMKDDQRKLAWLPLKDDHRKACNEAKSYKVSKKDMQMSPSSSESDLDYYDQQRALSKDVRRVRVARKKNYTEKLGNLPPAAVEDMDENLKPLEYSFGAGLAMASVLAASGSRLTATEIVFAGDGEASPDSGNDED